MPPPIDQSDKSHDAPVPYPTMHHFVTEMHMCAYFCYRRGYLSNALCEMCDLVVVSVSQLSCNYLSMLASNLSHVSKRVPESGNKLVAKIPGCTNVISGFDQVALFKTSLMCYQWSKYNKKKHSGCCPTEVYFVWSWKWPIKRNYQYYVSKINSDYFFIGVLWHLNNLARTATSKNTLIPNPKHLQ